ncbi:SPFH domain-containing protein [Sorangium sp. So ce233]|uniref:SPFH domain-containing protein n=1 Tax=Sorangium sp. So ce233 TaxID=3133290 RepID=UPI003F60B39E
MGIFDFVKSGVREMMIARPDAAKHLIVYKHPDQNVPFWSQLTVDSDECALFFKDGRYVGYLPTGRHTLQTQNIPFLNNLVNKFTGGDVFIAEIFFVKTQPVRGVPFGGPLESMEDPILYEFVTPRIFGEFSLVVVDPVRFVVGYHGQCGGSGDNDVVLSWIKGKFFMSVKTVIGQVCAQQQKSLLNLGGMSMELGARIVQSAPNLEEIGCKILEIGNFNINFSAEDQRLLREANKARGEARRGIGVAQDTARAKQFELDQRFQQDARYVQQLAGNWQNYAAGQAMVGAGQGMAKGGDGSGVAGLGAQVAIGAGLAQAMNPAMAAQGQPQFVPPHMQHPGAPQQGYPGAPQQGYPGAPQQGYPGAPQQGYPGAPQQGYPGAPQAAPAAGPTIEQRLERLADLKNKGLITDEEFQARKAKILEEI